MFNVMLFSSNDPGVDILFTILAVLATAGLGVVLFFRVRRERRLSLERAIKEGEKSVEAFEKFVRTAISAHKKQPMYFFRIDLSEYESVKKAIGEMQYNNMIEENVVKLYKLQPYGVKVAVRSDDSLYLFMRVFSNTDIESTCKLIIKTLFRKFTLSSTFSIDMGVNVAALVYPTGGNTFEEIEKSLEIAVVDSKRKGVNSYTLFNLELANVESDEYKYYEEIQSAIKNREFLLFYQPIVDAASLDVICGEALIRWTHKKRGIIPPAEFLYIMERTGDIVWVGQWCFEQLVKQAQAWKSNYEQKFLLSFNLSLRQLMEEGWADSLRRIAAKYHMLPSEFVFELENSKLYSTSGVVKDNIDRLASYGFKLAIDNLEEMLPVQTLKSLPISYIKMSKSFWSQAHEDNISLNLVKALVDYGKEYNVGIIAQWVSDVRDYEFLTSLGITAMQGFAFYKACDAKEFISQVVMTPWTSEIMDGIRLIASGEHEKVNASAQTVDVQPQDNAEEQNQQDLTETEEQTEEANEK